MLNTYPLAPLFNGNYIDYGNYIVIVVFGGINVFINFITLLLSAVFYIANVPSKKGPLVAAAGCQLHIYGYTGFDGLLMTVKTYPAITEGISVYTGI